MPAGETCFQGRGKNVAIDITNIQKMVFGVNYLGANGGKIVEELWNSRFGPEEAYLIQGSLQEGPKDVFLRFCEEYKRTNEKLGLKQYLIPYLISSHPGSRLEDAIEELRDRYGKRAITYATLMGDLKMPDDGRHSVKMPGLMYQ